MLSPWDDPIPLTRAWCLYEIYSTLISPGVKFDVVLPDAERAALKAAVMLRAESDLRSEVAAPDPSFVYFFRRGSFGFFCFFCSGSADQRSVSTPSF